MGGAAAFFDLDRTLIAGSSAFQFARAVGHPVAVNPDTELERVSQEEGWDVIRFETLGRRLKVGAGVVLAAVVGGVVWNRRQAPVHPARRALRTAARR